MTPAAAGGPRAARSLDAALVAVAAVTALAALVEFALFAGSGAGPLWVVDLFAVCALVYTAAGLVAWWRRPANRLGVIMVGGGLAWLLAGLGNTGPAVLAAIGTVTASVVLAVVVHLLLAFPSGRLRSTAARWTTLAAYFTSFVLQIPLYVFTPPASPGGMLAAADSPELAVAGQWAQAAVGAVVLVATAVILAGRLRRAPAAQRRVLLPLDVYGIVAVLASPLVYNVIRPLAGWSPAGPAAAEVVMLAVVPVAFAAGMLRGGFARTGEIAELGAWLGTDAASRPSLQEALARELGDDSVRLAYWVPGQDAYASADGKPLAMPGPGGGQGMAEVSLDGRRIGAIVYNSTLIADPDLVLAAGRVVALAMDRERLVADLLASQEALRESRIRLVEAADAERHRIARYLHDGVQTKLVLLALEAQQLAALPGAGHAVAAAATALRQRIDMAAAEVRELVHQVMPAPLIEGGLGAAVEDLADRMPVPVRLEIGVAGNLPAAVSAAAYFVVAEGLANAVKHARASKVGIRVSRDRDVLLVEVADDGVGGAARGRGAGLRSLADRADVLGGRLWLDSPAGQGTRLRAELPCGC